MRRFFERYEGAARQGRFEVQVARYAQAVPIGTLCADRSNRAFNSASENLLESVFPHADVELMSREAERLGRL